MRGEDRPLESGHAREDPRERPGELAFENQIARIDGPGQVTARVWERGVGETASSGTSAVAIAAATFGTGEVVVHFRGGDLRVVLEHGRATLFGPAERVA